MTFTIELVNAVLHLNAVLEEYTTDGLKALVLNSRQLYMLLHDAHVNELPDSVPFSSGDNTNIAGIPIKTTPLLAREKEAVFVPYPELGMIRYTGNAPMGVTGSQFTLQLPKRVDYGNRALVYDEFVQVPFAQCRVFGEVFWVTSYREYNWILSALA